MQFYKKAERNNMFLHEIGKKLIPITLYLFNSVNRSYFLYFGKSIGIYRPIIHILFRLGCYLSTLLSIYT
ncbi:hypothetical protein BCA_A0023 (plasmid) [Bacillus cereus 03BB102]|uniref:Uncharacterized protein n=1 Tax=Bacillus cereus (strain 03BB102) TaxID=572264 RepID=A0A158RFY7_BACC3|nr:hypothetical protein BCA_A0023 [Bacillus cereus 03BB102]